MVDTERLLGLYETMLRIRRFEERICSDFRDGRISGAIHLSIGQEAVATGVSANLRSDDYIFSTHRGHAHVVAKGAPVNGVMAEIWGKATGVCKGKGGSMHVLHRPSGVLGANGIVGGGAPIAAGAGMAIRHHKTDQVVVGYFGEGSVPNGAFHEGLTMACVFSLAMLFVGENNGYAETTSARFTLCGGTIVDRLAGYAQMRLERVDGMDAEAVDQAAKELVSWIRENQRPAALECETYRYRGHFEGDPVLYRTEEDVARWKERDPIVRAERRLREGGVDDETLERIGAQIAREIEEAAVFAAESPFPDPSETLVGVYVT